MGNECLELDSPVKSRSAWRSFKGPSNWDFLLSRWEVPSSAGEVSHPAIPGQPGSKWVAPGHAMLLGPLAVVLVGASDGTPGFNLLLQHACSSPDTVSLVLKTHHCFLVICFPLHSQINLSTSCLYTMPIERLREEFRKKQTQRYNDQREWFSNVPFRWIHHPNSAPPSRSHSGLCHLPEIPHVVVF